MLMLPIKSHMKGKCVPIVCPISVNTAGYLLRQFGLSTLDTQQGPSWDSNLLVTSLVFLNIPANWAVGRFRKLFRRTAFPWLPAPDAKFDHTFLSQAYCYSTACM